jgi:hypothetical protein
VAPALERHLTTGERFRTVKMFYEPPLLVAKLAALGWQADVHPIGWRFFYATVIRGAAGS